MTHRFCSVLRTISRNPRVFVHRQKLYFNPVTLSRAMVSYIFCRYYERERNLLNSSTTDYATFN